MQYYKRNQFKLSWMDDIIPYLINVRILNNDCIYKIYLLSNVNLSVIFNKIKLICSITLFYIYRTAIFIIKFV